MVRLGPLMIQRSRPARIDVTSTSPSKGEFSEIGQSGPTSIMGSVFNELLPKLRGEQAMRTYDEMRRSDASVRAALRIVKAPILAAEWYVEPANNTDEAKMHAEFIEWALGSMSRSFNQYLYESLALLDFGWYAFEKVFEYDTWSPKADGTRARRVVKWKKWGPRHPQTLWEWGWDSNGGVTGMWQNADNGVGVEKKFIPIGKMMLMTLDEESGNPEGLSILRSAYKHWFYKDNLYKIDGIQKERHGIGIPKGHMPPNYTDKDKRLMDEALENLRTNEKAKVNLPPGWDIEFLELKGQAVDPLASAIHHDHMIMKNVLAQFLNFGLETQGTRQAGAPSTEIFIKSTRYIADIPRTVFNRFAIRQLIRYNFGRKVTEFPELRVRGIGDAIDWRAYSVALRNMTETSVITPDPELEAWLRRAMDLPGASKDALDRTVKDRTEVKPSVKQGANTADRANMPADGG